MSINRDVNKQIVVYPYSRILFINKKGIHAIIRMDLKIIIYENSEANKELYIVYSCIYIIFCKNKITL